MKRSEPLPIGQVINLMKQRVADNPELRTAYILSFWPRVAGPHIAAYTQSTRLEGRLLHIYITSASLKEQLGYMRQALVKQFNNAVGENAIDNIIIH